MASRVIAAALVIIEEFAFGGVALVEQRLAEHCLPSLATLPESRKRTRSRDADFAKRVKNCATCVPESR